MDQKHTIIVVPPARAHARQFRVSNRQLLLAAGVVIGLTFLAVFTTWSFYSHRVNSSELARIRQENDSLRRVNQEFEQDLRSLRSRLADYETRTEQLAIIAGLDLDGSAGEAGVGGSQEAVLPLENLDRLGDLNRYAVGLDDRLTEVARRLEDRARRISSTPSIAPAKGLLTSAYGYRSDPITGERSLHRGIDIGTSSNRPVKATADGIVMRTGRDGALGNTVAVSHGFGVVTRYAHLAKVTVEPGQSVRQGDIIGYVGRTGRATGYHLHYEVRVDGRPVNPLGYMLDGLSGS